MHDDDDDDDDDDNDDDNNNNIHLASRPQSKVAEASMNSLFYYD